MTDPELTQFQEPDIVNSAGPSPSQKGFRPGNRLKYCALFALVGAFVCILAISAWFLFPRHSATFQGKPLSYWFSQLPLAGHWNSRASLMFVPGISTPRVDVQGRKYGSFLEEPEKSEEAIRAIGTNGLPFLFGKLSRHEPLVQKWVQKCATRFGLKRELFANVEAQRAQAVTALICLTRPPNKLPLDSVEHFLQLSTNADPQAAAAAKYVLEGANPDLLAQSGALVRLQFWAPNVPADEFVQFGSAQQFVKVSWFGTDILSLYCLPKNVDSLRARFCCITNHVPRSALERLAGSGADEISCELPGDSIVGIDALQKWLNNNVKAGWRVGVGRQQGLKNLMFATQERGELDPSTSVHPGPLSPGAAVP